MSENRAMRDVFIEQINLRMHKDESLFFVAADFGSPKLDILRETFKDRFINVGIAEQNLINISTGLALEGYTVYAYAIAPFLTMRAFEQIRNNLSLFSQTGVELNVNLIGVGAGLSYDVSGPTHHCLEDLTIMRALPNLIVFSPSDWVLAEKFFEYTVKVKQPKYLRFDGKPLPRLYGQNSAIDIETGFYELRKGADVCLVSTGYMTHQAVRVSEDLGKEGLAVGVVDIFLLKSADLEGLSSVLSNYQNIITLEEAYVNKGGLDSLVAGILDSSKNISLTRMGFSDSHVFNTGDREYLHRLNGLDKETIVNTVRERYNYLAE